MVTAGVYLVVRLHVVFSMAPLTLHIVGVVGAATALFAALCALAQTDLKRVLAYSTISQLGFMFLACSVQAYYAAMFHLTMHAFIKALLFLSAGNVVHMMHGTTALEKMGGLSKIFTKTHWLFLIGVAALAGIPPFAAFFSKDLILELEYLRGSEILYYMGLFASILTAIYMTRAYCLTFTGKPRSSPEELKSVEEAPGVMLLPVSILALLSIVGGFLGFAFTTEPPLETFLMEIGIHPLEKELSTGIHLSRGVGMAIGGSVLGILLTALAYAFYYPRLRKPLQILQKSFYVENLYAVTIVQPMGALAGWIAEFFEPKVFEASVDAAGEGAQGISALFQKVQSGQIRSYIAWMVMGTACLIFYFIFKGL
jgi:NADH-quinone oxidoreductase subunit L